MKTKSNLLINILTSLLILVVLLKILPVLGKGLSFSKHMYDNEEWKDYKVSDQEVTILIMGNSHVRTGINPLVISEITQQNTTMLSAGALNLSWVYYGLKEILPYKVPQVIVIESYVYDVRSRNAVYTPIARTIYGDNLIKAMPALFSVMDVTKIPYAWSPLVRYHDQWSMPYSQFVSNIQTDYSLTNPRFNGYEYHTNIVGQEIYTNRSSSLNPSRNLPSEYQYYTEKIIELGQQYQVPILFIKVPTVDSYAIHDEAVDQMVTSAGGIYYDFNSMFTEDPGYLRIHFMDAGGTPVNSHQNNIGALQSSVLLADILTDIMNFQQNAQKRESLGDLFLERLDIQKNEENGTFQIKIITKEENPNLQYEFELIKNGNSIEKFSSLDNIWIVDQELFLNATLLHFTVISQEVDFKVEGNYPIN